MRIPRITRTNKDHFLFSELKKIVYKTEALGDALKEKLSDLGDIQVAFIYGSTATGTEFSSSDIDLMIIGTIDVDLLEKTIEAIEEEIDRTVNYTLFNTAEWHERVRQGQSFVLDVSKNPKIFLMGTEDDLRSIAEIGSD